MNDSDIADLKKLRKMIYLTALAGKMKAAHLASSFSVLEILYALMVRKVISFRSGEPDWAERDRLLLSKGHAGLALYNIMAEVGYFSPKMLATFCRPGTRLGAEPNMRLLPGIEVSAGSLGHALSYGVGMALALKMKKNPAKVFVILGDGECEEGSIWEAVMAAAKHELKNLRVVLDWNGIQKMGPVKEIIGIVSWREKFESFGWSVRETDGHDVDMLQEALLKEESGNCPSLLIARTIKGKGVSFMENDPDWHYRMPNRRETKTIMQELDVSENEVNDVERVFNNLI